MELTRKLKPKKNLFFDHLPFIFHGALVGLGLFGGDQNMVEYR
jgi:hypothetical protein